MCKVLKLRYILERHFKENLFSYKAIVVVLDKKKSAVDFPSRECMF